MVDSSKLFVCPFKDCDYTGSEGWMHIKAVHSGHLEEAAAMLDKEKEKEEQIKVDKATTKLADGVRLMELMGRFAQRKDDAVQDDIVAVRSAITRCAIILTSTVPEGRELSIAMTGLESAYLWAKASLERSCQAMVDTSGGTMP